MRSDPRRLLPIVAAYLPILAAGARAAGTPVPLSLALATMHAALGVTLLVHAAPRALGRGTDILALG